MMTSSTIWISALHCAIIINKYSASVHNDDVVNNMDICFALCYSIIINKYSASLERGIVTLETSGAKYVMNI